MVKILNIFFSTKHLLRDISFRVFLEYSKDGGVLPELTIVDVLDF